MQNDLSLKFSPTMDNKQLADKLEQWADALAESGGQKWVLSVPVREDVDPDCLMIEAAKRLRLAPLAEPVEGMRWVKASERLPEEGKRVIVRWSLYDHHDRIDMSDAHQLRFWIEEDSHDYEWLDESSTPSAREAELERECERLKSYPVLFADWLTDHFEYDDKHDKWESFGDVMYTIEEAYELFKQQHNL